jgi:hypothetical protein
VVVGACGVACPFVALLKLPEPYDFALSTERFRSFGPDLANLWDGEALLRAVGGREVRIAPARGGVDVDPLDTETEPAVRKLLGVELDLLGFSRFAAEADPVLARLAVALAGFRPPLAPDPFEALVGSITAPSRRGSGSPPPSRRSSSRSASRAARRSTRSRSRGATSTSPAWAGCPRRRSARGSPRFRGSASGRSTGSSPATSAGRGPGRPATSRCGRRSPSSTGTARR